MNLSLQHIQEIYEAAGYGDVGSKRARTFAARGAGLAACDFEESLKPRAGLAGAYASSSVQGYSQVADALYARSTAENAGIESAAVLKEWLPKIGLSLQDIKSQRGFAIQVPVQEVN